MGIVSGLRDRLAETRHRAGQPEPADQDDAPLPRDDASLPQDTPATGESAEETTRQGALQAQLKLLQGEMELERLGNDKRTLILTNKRVVYLSREGNTSRAAVAFMHDIVSARMRRSRHNKLFPAAGIGLAVVALLWSLVSGLGNGFDSPTMAIVLIADMILVLGCLVLYQASAFAIIVFKTANDEIVFSLGREDNMYRFINRWLELKDAVS
jgi:hypothetical protein